MMQIAAIAGLVAWLLVATTAENARSEPGFPAIVVAQASAAEIEFWRSVESSKDPAEFEAYLKAYPTGQFTPLANIRLKKLRSEGQPGAAAGASKPAEPPQGLTARGSAAADASIPPAPPHKSRGWIGVQIKYVDKKRARDLGLAEASGVEIESVTAGGPAAKSGLEPRDVVLSIEGEPMVDQVDRGRLAHNRLALLVQERTPGRSAEFLILRDRDRRTLNVVVADYFEQIWSAAHRGDPAAMLNLGSLFAQGQLVEKDPSQANVWFRRAADAGNVQAMHTLGWRYEQGLGVERSGREAASWYRKAVDGGHDFSMLMLGFLHKAGRGVERDFGEAARWFKLGADKGSAAAMVEYGQLLELGRGVPRNEALAVDYYRRAANLDNSRAHASLGIAYFTGRGVGKDLRQAAEWFRKAADRGEALGFHGLALMYEAGQGGLPKDRNEAVKYFRKAAAGGQSGAVDRLKKLRVSVHDPDEVQKLLADLGFDPGPRPGPRTGDAIRKFQQSRGLPVDGTASLRLIGQLREALKQKTAADAKTAEPAQDRAAAPPDLGDLTDLEKLDAPQ